MEDNKHTPITDEFLKSLQGMKPAEPNPFFFTRLKGRMEQQLIKDGFFFKPAWVIGTLAFFLTINIWMIMQGNVQQQGTEKNTAEQVFAETYNLNNDSNY